MHHFKFKVWINGEERKSSYESNGETLELASKSLVEKLQRQETITEITVTDWDRFHLLPESYQTTTTSRVIADHMTRTNFNTALDNLGSMLFGTIFGALFEETELETDKTYTRKQVLSLMRSMKPNGRCDCVVCSERNEKRAEEILSNFIKF